MQSKSIKTFGYFFMEINNTIIKFRWTKKWSRMSGTRLNVHPYNGVSFSNKKK